MDGKHTCIETQREWKVHGDGIRYTLHRSMIQPRSYYNW